MEKYGRRHLTQVIKNNFVTCEYNWQHGLPDDDVLLERAHQSSAVLLRKVHELNLIMKIDQTNPNWCLFYKISGLCSSKDVSAMKEKDSETISNKKELKRPDNWMQCMVLDFHLLLGTLLGWVRNWIKFITFVD